MAPSFQRPRALGKYLVQPFMLTRPVSLARRATVIAGKRYEDDFTMIWRGLAIGRIMQASGVPAHLAQWSWNCSVHGKPGGSANGNGTDLDDCKAKFSSRLCELCFCGTARIRGAP
jgi:hypothetical protein